MLYLLLDFLLFYNFVCVFLFNSQFHCKSFSFLSVSSKSITTSPQAPFTSGLICSDFWCQQSEQNSSISLQQFFTVHTPRGKWYYIIVPTPLTGLLALSSSVVRWPYDFGHIPPPRSCFARSWPILILYYFILYMIFLFNF